MADETIITWSPENWATVVFMVVVGFLFLALLAQLWHNFKPQSLAA